VAVDSGVIVGWPSTAASIPSGWSRKSALDSRYLRGSSAGADADLTTDNGALTHTHTSPAHTPTQAAHVHGGIIFASHTAPEWEGSAPRDTVAQSHSHATITSTSETAVTNSAALSVDAASNDPVFATVIWIESDGTPAGIPVGAVAFFASDSLPSGWTRVDGDSFLKGAAAGADGGGSGGAATHAHTHASHVHTAQAHQHFGNSTDGASVATNNIANPNAIGFATVAHVHTFDTTAATQTINAYTVTINAADGQPPFRKINVVRNDGASPDIPGNIIGVWGGTAASIPAGWSRFSNLDDQFVKGAAANGQSDVDTGGATSHGHTAADCQPTIVNHDHSGATNWSIVGTLLATDAAAPGSNRRGALEEHTHGITGISGAATSHNAVAVTIDACSTNAALPQYRRVIFIQFTGGVVVPQGFELLVERQRARRARGRSRPSMLDSWPLEPPAAPEEDPGFSDLLHAGRRRDLRGSRVARVLRALESVEEPLEEDVAFHDLLHAARRRDLRGLRPGRLLRAWTGADFEEAVVEELEAATDLLHAARRRDLRGLRPGRLLRAWTGADLEEAAVEELEAATDLLHAARRRDLRGLRPGRLLRVQAWVELEEAVIEELGPSAMELVHALRRRDLRGRLGYSRFLAAVQGNGSEPPGPFIPPPPPDRRHLGEYFWHEMFHRHGITRRG